MPNTVITSTPPNTPMPIGPYNHIGAQRSAWDVLRGYKIDPVANIDIGHVLRYQWFDYVLRGGPRPPLLQDKVNYEVMGANQWRTATDWPVPENFLKLVRDNASPTGDVLTAQYQVSARQAMMRSKTLGAIKRTFPAIGCIIGVSTSM